MKHLAGVLVLALTFFLCMPAQARSYASGGFGKIGPIVSRGEVIGIVVGIVAAVTVVIIVAVVVIRKASAKRITGCVKPAQNGMTVNDEKDGRIYALSGDLSGVKPGERLSLQGKKIKPNAGNPPSWEIAKIRADLGVCQP